MLFLGIISFKGISCFNGRVVFFRWGGSFLSEGVCPMGEDISFDGGVFEKIVRWGGGCTPQCPPTVGDPGKGGILEKGGGCVDLEKRGMTLLTNYASSPH